ncbi:MAG: adenosylcobinamide-GDP ribazoletransferase [Opitutaceae bacterium]|jgi:adenosylcobinamide-GDP ribazoletransferase|nr:adenosylcobinamide-GDP ribazoletransferase [Opitutaceae bacterium]
MASFPRNEFRALHSAVMFFTRIPLPSLTHYEDADLQRSSTYFPLVGWLVGAVAAAVWWAGLAVWTPAVASGASLAATLLLTGAFHEDGFADMCDGFGGGHTRARILEIMRDSRIGAFGAIGLVMLLGLKWHAVEALAGAGAVEALAVEAGTGGATVAAALALAEGRAAFFVLPPAWLAPAIILAAHAVSRGAAISLLATLPYARESGKAKPLSTRLRGGRLVVAMLLALAPLALLPVRLWWALAAVVLARAWMAWRFRRRIGGYTGDCLGAAQQVCELAFYLAALALL